MEDEIAPGYGSAQDMMGQGPMDAELAGAPPTEDAGGGGEVEAMIAEGVQAFMETQDPQVAVQVVMMLAESMGLSGGQQSPDQGGQPAPAPAPAGSTPMAKHGGKFGWFGNEGIASDFQKFVTTK